MSVTQEQPLRFESRAAYRAWVEQQPRGRYEMEDGHVVAMAPERVGHAIIKARAWASLERAIEGAELDCRAFPDGVTVEVDDHTDYEPDAVVTCGTWVGDDDLVARNPVIVVEVLSPATGHRDATVKLGGYFSLPSVEHYLLISADKRLVVHHRRDGTGTLTTRLHTAGTIELSPPGLRIEVADLYKGTGLAASTS